MDGTKKLGAVGHLLINMPSLMRRRQGAQAEETMYKQLIAQTVQGRTWLVTDVAGAPAPPPRSHHVESRRY